MAVSVQKIPTIPFAAVCVSGIALCFFPLFRVVPLQTKGAVATAAVTGSGDAAPAAFDPAAFTEKFWRERLTPAAARATDSTALVPALRRDPAAAAKQFARVAGVGGSGYYFFRGTGRVTAVERNRVLLDLDGVTVALGTGPLFGNTVRDGTGLLNVNDFPGLAEFNALSAELNRLVEAQVFPVLRERARVGATLAFAGCAEAPESIESGPLLVVVPVEISAAP
ncbi:MAG: DUF2291 family protein [Verrucomicrobia bacterium]|nr:DUF2291 family protein [Verrucomicrobiota bacterium]